MTRGNTNHPSRRTLVAGTMWAVPAVVVASAAPALAASGALACTARFSRGSSACRTVDANGQVTGYDVRLCAAPSGPCAAGTTITVRTITGDYPELPVQDVNQSFTFSGAAFSCVPNHVFYRTSNKTLPGFVVTYQVNGGPILEDTYAGPIETCIAG